MKKNFLVIGKGWVGHKMVEELTSRNHAVKFVSSIAPWLDEKGYYNAIVNCAGVTGTPNVDACENNKSETYMGNAIYPIELYHKLQYHCDLFAHFSSGCIYEGEIDSPYAAPNFFGSTYSISKGISDQYLVNQKNTAVFRIRMPFDSTWHDKNYLKKVYNYALKGKLIDAGQNSLTDLDEAVRVACDILEYGVPGPYNLVNKGSVNMHELVGITGMEISPEWFTPEEFRISTAAGRSTCTIPACPGMSDIKTALKTAWFKSLGRK